METAQPEPDPDPAPTEVRLRTGHIVRPASAADTDAVLGLFDAAIRWFAKIGNPGQWGRIPFSERPERVDQVHGWCREPGSWVAVDSAGRIGGALVLGEAHDYVPASTVAELYVKVLIGSRPSAWRGVGRALLAFADDRARDLRVERLRVDCYAGGSGDLVRFYESCGYVATESFRVRDWPGQLLERPLY